ncbi:MAG: hypothetical protein GF418_04545, partial [Chitinivibrionales bacterium]|nr:hypothetical protein [Chitinivibrionales bacterium]MBD3394877.1 hypothetical protein [Chitinivibrionales bacterium]
GDILQDILNHEPQTGLMAGVETHAKEYCDELAESDYLVTQLIFENEPNSVTPKIQGAMKKVFFVDADRDAGSWRALLDLARDPRVQFATINAPEGVYGVSYSGGTFARPVDPVLVEDMEKGTIVSNPAKWAAFACERFSAGLNFALVSCTNFSGNGEYTGATVRTVARAWEEKGLAPAGFVEYLSDPSRFSFPNTMIDRIAVPPDSRSREIMQQLGIHSNIVVTEKCRYWAVEDMFPAGRPAFERAEGVFMCPDYADVKRYEDMKLRILNMSHSVIAGLGVLLGYRGAYGIYHAMQDRDLDTLIRQIVDIVLRVIDPPKQANPADFARDTFERLNNPNIPDDPMRIALNASTKMQPRFLDTYFDALEQGMPLPDLDIILVPVAGFLRYTLGIDDAGNAYELESDPKKDLLVSCGGSAILGSPDSANAFRPLVADADVMGADLYARQGIGDRLEGIVAGMLGGQGAVRKTVKRLLQG